MRICLVYDCLFPHTVGGAERWYRNLGQRLAREGHQVTYLTLRQWDRGTDPGVEGVDVRAVGPRMRLYSSPGRRRILPPLVFGAGVLWYLLRRGRRFEVVHTASFPDFSLLAAAMIRPLAGFRLVVDWHEVWSRDYWREYLGTALGAVGWAVQLACVRLRQRAFCFSRCMRRVWPSTGCAATCQSWRVNTSRVNTKARPSSRVAVSPNRWWYSPAVTSRRSAPRPSCPPS